MGCRNQLDKSKLLPGVRVALDMTTLTIMRQLPREVRALLSLKSPACFNPPPPSCQVDPTVYNMKSDDEKGISFAEIGGLNEQIRELRETIELPLTNPELFVRVTPLPNTP